ncbi:phospho-N-acetylmuramoyl-pentapeptide-transferase [Sinobaca qinghaiensis]|uniref:Phospho-N-acetylmuramoyl-pentapeptide-transferase n=2 Tax=Sinobaca qinghaiensis TaxID=342944 RepID=A0A419V6H9_9BACL|nr:phospho-N-acetylmuramoyl-pentapeptide-transferase [Sinobaca qinghaiensis]RKD75451.1 phospho-N-acetylmuramoyl-pentapeptide-transferase [Sinobaca qinghaiensis]
MALNVITASILAFVFMIILTPFFIPALKKFKFGQSIREEGPESHMKKGGTPTMGGIVILVSLILTMLVMTIWTGFSTELFLLLLVTIGFGTLGFLDDFIKIVKKRNLGLTSKQKLAGQAVIALIFFIVIYSGDFSTSVSVPATNFSIDLGFMYFFLVIFMLVGASNAVNLTDGLDGLLAGTGAVAFLAFAILAWIQGASDVAVFSFAIVGACLGFLVFNAHPAKVFMGDTGSLALGGAIAAIAILLGAELILVIIGGVFVIETLSVIIQVASFKLRGKRIFKMSPIHHHFELSGWSEWKVVTVFWSTGLVLAVAGIIIEVLI